MDDIEDPSKEFLESTRFWIQKVFVPILVCIGVGGNTLTVMVLTRKRMRCSTNIYLTALAIADIIYLLFVLTLSFKVYNNIDDRKYELYWRFLGLTHWLVDAASSASVWLTVSFTIERYIVVCHPIKGKVLCTENRAKSIIVIVAIFCILTTASTTFEYELALNENCIRNCTNEELIKKMSSSSSTTQYNQHHYQPGNSLNTTKIHYLPNHNNVLLITQKNLNHPHIIREIYNKIQPQLENILVHFNCSNSKSSSPHIIYVPFIPSSLSLLKNKSEATTNQLNTNIIEDKTNSDLINNTTEIINNKLLFNEDEDTNDNFDKMDNDTCCVKHYTVSTVSTNLAKNKTYSTLISWYSAITFGLLPLVLIATFNCFLVHAVYKSQRRRRKMTNSMENVSMSNENRITVMLIGVVVLFLICQTPTASFLIYSNFYEPEDAFTSNIHHALGNIFNFLVMVNASCNFITYCVLSKKYRTTFKSLFCERGNRKNNRQDTLLLSSTRQSQRFNSNSYKNGFRRNISEYHTPRNLETQSLTSAPRSKSLIMRPPGKAKSTDLNV